jgi:archaeosine synthase
VHFEIAERDGLARIGILEIDGVKHETPAVAYVDSQRYRAPDHGLKVRTGEGDAKGHLAVDSSLFGILQGVRSDGLHLDPGSRGSRYAQPAPAGDMVILEDISQALLDSAKFVEQVVRVKSGADLVKPVYCSTIGLPHRLALLAYCGIDLFDSVPLIMAAVNGLYLTTTGILRYDSVKDLPCACPACASGMRTRDELLRHNYSVAESEARHVRHAIRTGTLRELVEARVRADPWLVQDLRLLDMHHYGLQEMHAPIKGAPFHAGSKESLARPDVIRWQRRLEERYARPRSAKVLVLIPCSAKKPYSTSQSHLRFREAISASGRKDLVHEVIVTSPLGLVPRELELFYPAQDYDIPVTGHWDRDEKKLAEEMVSWLVSSQKYDLVISHLGDEREPVNAVLGDFIDTSQGAPGARDSLGRLTETLKEHVPEPGGQGSWDRDIDDMRSLCRFQFGPAGEAICEGARVAGRWPYLKIVRDGLQLGMLTGDRGMISLTLDGGRTLAESGAYTVQIEDFKPKGNLFAVGVKAASPEIRIGDDVAVANGKDLRAVGVARMSPAEMKLVKRGEAVHIRHVAP